MDNKDEGLERESTSLDSNSQLTTLSKNIEDDEDVVKIDKEQEVNELVEDFKAFLNVDVTSKTADIEILISGILAKLEEFCTVMEMIRTESKDVFFTIAPVLHERCEEIKPLFKKIDQLEQFIGVVRESVDDAEEKVRIAEKEVGSKNIKKILNNVPVPKFLLKKKEIQSYMKKDVTAQDYQGLKRFSTDDYFEPYVVSEDSQDHESVVEE